MREKERERERGLRGSKTSHRLRTPFSSIVPPSRVSTVARHLLALCPWRKEKSFDEREADLAIRSFVSSKRGEGRVVFFFFLFSKRFSPL